MNSHPCYQIMSWGLPGVSYDYLNADCVGSKSLNRRAMYRNISPQLTNYGVGGFSSRHCSSFADLDCAGEITSLDEKGGNLKESKCSEYLGIERQIAIILDQLSVKVRFFISFSCFFSDLSLGFWSGEHSYNGW